MTDHADADERRRARSDSHAFMRRMAAGLGIPLLVLLDVRPDSPDHVISVIGVNSAAGVPEVHVGTAVLTPEEAMALGRDIRWVIAQQRARGPWSLLWTLLRARVVDLAVDARYGLTCVAAHRPRRRGGAQ